MNAWRLVISITCASWLLGCGDGPVVPSPEQEPGESVSRQALSENRRLFEQSVGSSYTYEYRNVCFCISEFRANVRVTVRDGARVSVVLVEDGSSVPAERWNDYLTVTEIFDDIQRALDEGAASVRVQFDETLGYPSEVFIDVDELIADEERGYSVRNLQAAR